MTLDSWMLVRARALLIVTPLALALLLWAQPAGAATQEDIYDPYCVTRVDITASQSALDALTIDPKGAYQPATMIVNVCGSEELPAKNITFRLKGSGSFQPLSGKAAFKIKMSSPNRIDGLKSLTLNNMVQDDSMIHEALAYKALRAVGVTVPRTGYAIVSITNSDTGALADYGLHANIESYDDRFLDANYGAGTWGHLYEGPSWIDFGSPIERDIVPESVPNFELEESGDGALETDLAELAAIHTIENDDEWWAAFRQKFETTKVLRHFAADVYIADPDNYMLFTNNYYLHSTIAGVFDVLPSGKDQSFSGPTELDPAGALGQVLDRCFHVTDCRAAFRSARNLVAEAIIDLDLVSEAHQLFSSIAPAVAADTRKPQSVARQCEAANETIQFLIEREIEWRIKYRLPDAGITSRQSSEQLRCDPPVSTPRESLPPTGGVLINSGAKFTKTRNVQLMLSWPAQSASVEISNDAHFVVARTFGRSTPIDWTLPDVQGPTRVFVRFAGGVSASDEISIDSVRPAIRSVKIRALSKNRFSLALTARERNSGVHSIQIQTSRGRKPLKRAFGNRAAHRFTARAREIRVRVLDQAANASRWRSVTLPRT